MNVVEPFPTEVDCSTCGARVELVHAFASHEDGDRVWTCADCLERIPGRPGWRRDRNGREWYSAAWLSTFAVFVAAITLAAVCAFLAPARAAAASSFPAIDAIASSIAGHPSRVVCESPDEWAADPNSRSSSLTIGDVTIGGSVNGYAIVGGAVAHLSPRECGGLLLAASDTTRARGALLRRLNPSVNVIERAGEAIATLAHESEHLAGNRAEIAADCAAYVELPYAVGELVGNTRDAAKILVAARASTQAAELVHGGSC